MARKPLPIGAPFSRHRRGGLTGRVMPSTAALCWANARECRRWAEQTNSEAERKAFLEMAKTWTQLALQEQGPPADDESRHLAARR